MVLKKNISLTAFVKQNWTVKKMSNIKQFLHFEMVKFLYLLE